MVADALSRKPVNLNVILGSLPPEIQEEIAQLNLVIVDAGLANILEVAPTLEAEIRKAQLADAELQRRANGRMESRPQISPRTNLVPSDFVDGFVYPINRT